VSGTEEACQIWSSCSLWIWKIIGELIRYFFCGKSVPKIYLRANFWKVCNAIFVGGGVHMRILRVKMSLLLGSLKGLEKVIWKNISICVEVV
jgi:hypothetical protein